MQHLRTQHSLGNPANDVNYQSGKEELTDEEKEEVSSDELSEIKVGTRYVEDLARSSLVGRECTICFEEFEEGNFLKKKTKKRLNLVWDIQ